MVDPAGAAPSAQEEALPAELERRIAAIAPHAATADFDAASWFWMLLLGVALPIALLIVGWLL